MRMNKIFATLASKALALATTAMMSMVFTACSSDNNDPTPDPNADKYVDLGLSVKWAKCNLGAMKAYEYGNYYAWGETASNNIFNWGNYTLCNGDQESQLKYCTNPAAGHEDFTDGLTVLEPADDAATATLGSPWRMPTIEEITELRTKCTWQYISINSIKGCLVTGPNGNTIFLPAAGYRIDDTLYKGSKEGFYWSSSLETKFSISAHNLKFSSSGNENEDSYRFFGIPVRPVHP